MSSITITVFNSFME